MESINYNSSDTWLLQSIILSGEKGASLFDIISIGDAINHAIFTNHELESGFSKLFASGLISEKNESFFPTSLALEIYEKSKRRGGNIYIIRERLEEYLNTSKNCGKDRKALQNNLKSPGFSNQKVNEAINRWHKESQKLMGKN